MSIPLDTVINFKKIASSGKALQEAAKKVPVWTPLGTPFYKKARKRELMFWGMISGAEKVVRGAPGEIGAGLGGP